MGNLIKDFWTYTYKEKNYYGVIEVVKGDLKFRRRDKKFETRIEKAIDYIMSPGTKVLSHMSVQAYNQYLKSSSRHEGEEAYYPFFVELEPKVSMEHPDFALEYKKAVQEAYRLATYLIHELEVEEEDILITINNARSIYVFVNPKSYKLRPGKDLHKIYKKIYEEMNERLNLQTADMAQFRFFGLIKTPGSYYKGGFVVPISYKELGQLTADPNLKKQFTREKREINIMVPGKVAPGMIELYENAKDACRNEYINRSWSIYANDKPTEKSKKMDTQKVGRSYKTSYITHANCIKHLENSFIEKGKRNYALVSLAIAYKKSGYSQEQVYDAVQQAAYKWQHDENESVVRSKVKTVFDKNYNFSCSYVKENMGIENSCRGCKFCGHGQVGQGQNSKFKINRHAIDLLTQKKASLRHFKAYVMIEHHNLFDQPFDPEEYGLDQRTIRELAKFTNMSRILESGQVKLEMTIPEKSYVMPSEFVTEDTVEALGESLKHFLILYTNYAYKATEKYGLMRVSIKKIMTLLNYRNKQGVYMLLRKLKEIGLAVYKKGYLFALYFRSYKIIPLDDYKYTKTSKKMNIDKIRGGQAVINGMSITTIELSRGSP